MHESLMQDDQLSNPNFDDNADIRWRTKREYCHPPIVLCTILLGIEFRKNVFKYIYTRAYMYILQVYNIKFAKELTTMLGNFYICTCIRRTFSYRCATFGSLLINLKACPYSPLNVIFSTLQIFPCIASRDIRSSFK